MCGSRQQLPARFLHGSGAMATFTTEQFGELVASTMALSQALSANSQVAAAMTPGGGADRRDRGSRKLSMKACNRVTKFAQGEAQWKEFHFDFGVLIGAEYPPLLETLKVVEQMPDETDAPMVRALDGEFADRPGLGESVQGAARSARGRHGGRSETDGQGCPQQ